jgi:hypothetical protein
MPAARGLAGEIAELVGRPASEGWVFTRYLQDAGIFAKGRGGRGGAGSPRAEPWQAVTPLLSLVLGSAPKAAIADTAHLYNLPFTGAMLFVGGEQVAVERDGHGATFGVLLTGLIQCRRLGAAIEALPQRILVGIIGDQIVGQLFANTKDDAGNDATEIWMFSQPVGVDTSNLVHSTRSFPGCYLSVIADKLGPLATSGGGGGEGDQRNTYGAQDQRGNLSRPFLRLPPRHVQ